MKKLCDVRNLLSVIVIILLFTLYCPAELPNCDCGNSCSGCGSTTPKYILAQLSGFVCCDDDFQQAASAGYPCFGGDMTVVLTQETDYPCCYSYYGSTFYIDGSAYQHRLLFWLDFAGDGSTTDFWVILQQNCGGWFDLFWSIASDQSGSCTKQGSAQFSSLCNSSAPDIQSGLVNWQQAVMADGNCPSCEPNDIGSYCGQFNCANLSQYTILSGSEVEYSGPRKIYSPPQCGDVIKKGNIIRTAKLYCDGADLVTATASSSAPNDVKVSPSVSSCSSGDSVSFTIEALRGRATVILSADFYKKASAANCFAVKSSKTVTIEVLPSLGDNCCQSQFKPLLLAGSPGNVSTPIMAGTNPLEVWPQATIYQNGSLCDIEAILPGEFSPVIFNNGKPPQYLRGFSTQIDGNDIVVFADDGRKYIYERQDGYKISEIISPSQTHLAEFIYDSNYLPLYQNDLTDSNFSISYGYDANGFLTTITEYGKNSYRQFGIEYDSVGLVSFVSSALCSSCSGENSRKYFYDSFGNLKYEKNVADQLLYEYLFDSQDRLKEKWLGAKTENRPVEIIAYTDMNDGYIADVNLYVDDANCRCYKKYYSKAGILERQTSYPYAGSSGFDEYFLYQYDANSQTIISRTEISALAEYSGDGEPACPRSQTVYDANSGEILQEIVYDANNTPTVISQNYYNGTERIVRSTNAYGAETVYNYADDTVYPNSVILPQSDGLYSSGQLEQIFIYDSDNNIQSRRLINAADGNTIITTNYSYDSFGNLTSLQKTDGNDINEITEYFYNDYNQLIRTIEPSGKVCGKKYDAYGRLVGEFVLADANGINQDEPNLISQKIYAYDANGLICFEAEAADSSKFAYDQPARWIYTDYCYDSLGRVIKIIEDANGMALEMNFEYNRQNDIIKITSPGSKWTEFLYDGRGLKTAEITGFAGNDYLITEYDYDAAGNLSYRITPDGRADKFQYSPFGRLICHKQMSIADANVSIDNCYQYNADGKLIYHKLLNTQGQITDEKLYDYDNLGRCDSFRHRQNIGDNDDANDFMVAYGYDCFDDICKKIIKIDDANSIILNFKYDGLARLSKAVDGEGRETKLRYSFDDEIKAVENALGYESVNYFDNYGRIIKTQKPEGNYEKTGYDSLGQITRKTVYDFNDIAVVQKRFEYDSLGRTIKEITMADALQAGDVNTATDNVVIYDYNSTTGRLDKDSSSTYRYDCIGRLQKIIDILGNEVEFVYDVNFPLQIAKQNVFYNDPCNPITVQTDISYDAFGRPAEAIVREANGTEAYWQYDADGKIIKKIDIAGIETDFEYNRLGRLIKTIEDGNRITEFSYDRAGRQIAITAYDVNSQKTEYRYDKNNNITKIIYPDGKSESFVYDAVNKCIEKTLRSGAKIYLTYDLQDNLVEITDDINSPQILSSFEYRPDGLIRTARKEANGQIQSQNEFAYNGFGKITKETVKLFNFPAVEINYCYDANGNITELQIGGRKFNYSYDAGGRVKTIYQNGLQLAALDYFGSALSDVQIADVELDYSRCFDTMARVNRCLLKNSSQQTLLDLSYVYDSACNRLPTGSRYQFDSLNRLCQTTNEQIEYNPFGSRKTVEKALDIVDTYTTNSLNQYTKIFTDFNFGGLTSETTLCWDDNGSLTYSGIDGLEYGYDIFGNLIKANCNTQTAVEFAYDALGRRISKQTPDGRKLFYYDLNNRPVAEYTVIDANNAVLSCNYVYGSGQNQIIAKLLPENTGDANSILMLMQFCNTYLYGSGQEQYDANYDYDDSGFVDMLDFAQFMQENQFSLGSTGNLQWYYFTDALGSVVAVADQDGDCDFYSYDSFGNIATGAIGSGFKFAGYYYDAEINKYYCNNRYYAPQLGCFISVDPLGYANGFNLYDYCMANPTVLTDPLGLKSTLLQDMGFLIGLGKTRADAARMADNLKQIYEFIRKRCLLKYCLGSKSNPACKKLERIQPLYLNSMKFDEALNIHCAQAAAVGTAVGVSQGLLNSINGVQDSAIGSVNLGLGVWNYSGALLFDKQLGYVPSPDWSAGLLMVEGEVAHNISKFAGGNGAITLATAGAGSLNSAKNSANATEGIYEFVAASGKKYIGQSADIPRRIAQHIKSGKLLAGNLKTLRITQVKGGRLARSIAEQGRIDKLGGIKNLENLNNAIRAAKKGRLMR